MNPRRIRPELPGAVKRTIMYALFFTAPFFFFAYLVGGDTLQRNIRNYRLVHSGLKSSGVIIEYRERWSIFNRKDVKELRPVVKFGTHDGRTVTFESLYHPHYSGFSIGQTVPVLYDRDNPHDAEIDKPERLWGGMGVPYAVSGALILIGCWPLVALRTNSRRRHTWGGRG
ncbi:DUF3592 domain-containing protein [Oryzomonas japonica]|uniref:DUF3592 domain-containing protein n=1 Tax=Oryzomonas japonica TaxID=2603858 RepID=A0A7J4ZMN3_9BACT|nr:DUF3592 domain-containing protein [Oryzomonas japonica]KAB0663995.1 DUF3592 domain-containing protein [Oryzomonas japonica]